jgi:hypothetical protein
MRYGLGIFCHVRVNEKIHEMMTFPSLWTEKYIPYYIETSVQYRGQVLGSCISIDWWEGGRKTPEVKLQQGTFSRNIHIGHCWKQIRYLLHSVLAKWW